MVIYYSVLVPCLLISLSIYPLVIPRPLRLVVTNIDSW